jgi:hypothetical protein
MGDVILHVTRPDLPVNRIYGSNMYSQEQFARARCRARYIFEPEHFRPAIVMNSYAFIFAILRCSLGKSVSRL